MIKEQLRDSEPIAYTTLLNALKDGSLAHSYLFSGELNPLKTKAAILLAQSIVEDSGDFACEECKTCKRIEDGLYFDVIYLDGHKESIKDAMIEDIMSEFSKTALEYGKKKIYIIDNVNNMSIKAMNHLLKFMEEPSSENIYGIFITDDIDGLLPTIVSRCQTISFRTHDFSSAIEAYKQKGFEETDAYLLVNIFHSFNQDIDLNDNNYLLARDAIYMLIENLKTPLDIPALLYKNYYQAFGKGKDSGFNDSAEYFVVMLETILQDSILDKKTEDHEYDHFLKILSENQPAELLAIVHNIREKMASNVDRKLLFDQMAFEIISYISR